VNVRWKQMFECQDGPDVHREVRSDSNVWESDYIIANNGVYM